MYFIKDKAETKYSGAKKKRLGEGYSWNSEENITPFLTKKSHLTPAFTFFQIAAILGWHQKTWADSKKKIGSK